MIGMEGRCAILSFAGFLHDTGLCPLLQNPVDVLLVMTYLFSNGIRVSPIENKEVQQNICACRDPQKSPQAELQVGGITHEEVSDLFALPAVLRTPLLNR